MGLGFSFSSGPLVFLPIELSAPISGVSPFVVSRVQKSLVAFVVWVRLYLCIRSCLGTRLWLIFYFSFSVFDPDLDIFSFRSDQGLSSDERVFFRLSFYHFPLLYPPTFWLYGKAMCSSSGFLFFEKKNWF